MTPEVRDLGEEFRKPKLEEVTTEYLSRVVTDPTVVVIEDAHWMDEASAGLLRSIARRITDLPWLVCVSRRDEETGFVLPEGPRCTSLKLTPLSEDAMGGLIDLATEDAPFPRHEVERAERPFGWQPSVPPGALAGGAECRIGRGIPGFHRGDDHGRDRPARER